MEIEGNPINVIVEGIERERLKKKLESECRYTDVGIGQFSFGADQIWKFLDTPQQNQIHVRMWRNSHPYFAFFSEIFEGLYKKVTGREHIRKVYCSPHYEPGYENPAHAVMIIEGKSADYETGRHLFGMDLANIGFECISESNNIPVYRGKEK
jgi:hypothetical protein